MKHSACNYILHLNWTQESSPQSLIDAYKCPDSSAPSEKNTRSSGILKADAILWVIPLPAWRATSTPIIFWLRHDHWPDTVWEHLIFLSTLWRSPPGRGVTTQLMGTSKEMWYLRTTSDSSPQLSFLWHDTLYSYLRLFLLAKIIQGFFFQWNFYLCYQFSYSEINLILKISKGNQHTALFLILGSKKINNGVKYSDEHN